MALPRIQPLRRSRARGHSEGPFHASNILQQCFFVRCRAAERWPSIPIRPPANAQISAIHKYVVTTERARNRRTQWGRGKQQPRLCTLQSKGFVGRSLWIERISCLQHTTQKSLCDE